MLANQQKHCTHIFKKKRLLSTRFFASVPDRTGGPMASSEYERLWGHPERKLTKTISNQDLIELWKKSGRQSRKNSISTSPGMKQAVYQLPGKHWAPGLAAASPMPFYHTSLSYPNLMVHRLHCRTYPASSSRERKLEKKRTTSWRFTNAPPKWARRESWNIDSRS